MNNEQTPLTPDALTTILAEIQKNHCFEPATKRGAPYSFSELSFLMLAVTAVILRTFKNSELHRLLRQDTGLRERIGFVRVPHRVTIGRRLCGLLPVAEARIAELGQRFLAEMAGEQSAVSAVDGRMYEAVGPKWHARHRAEGFIPPGLRNVDTESTWSKSAYRNWIQGFRLVCQSCCGHRHDGQQWGISWFLCEFGEARPNHFRKFTFLTFRNPCFDQSTWLSFLILDKEHATSTGRGSSSA